MPTKDELYIIHSIHALWPYRNWIIMWQCFLQIQFFNRWLILDKKWVHNLFRAPMEHLSLDPRNSLAFFFFLIQKYRPSSVTFNFIIFCSSSDIFIFAYSFIMSWIWCPPSLGCSTPCLPNFLPWRHQSPTGIIISDLLKGYECFIYSSLANTPKQERATYKECVAVSSLASSVLSNIWILDHSSLLN